MIVASKSRSAIDKLQKDLFFKFEIKDLGKAKKVLCMEIEGDQRDGKVSLTQKRYLKKILQKFNINGDIKSVKTPLAPHFKLKVIVPPISVKEREHMIGVPYATVIDSLMYAMVCTRPNLLQIISMVSRYMHVLAGVIGRQ